MEERRLKGGRLLKVGKLSQGEIARQLEVSRATVSEWAKTVKEKGIRGLRKRKAAGGVAKLTEDQNRNSNDCWIVSLWQAALKQIAGLCNELLN